MEHAKKTAQSHMVRSCMLVFGIAVFANCFGFPVYNLNKEWPFSLTAVYALSTPALAVFSGGSLAALFPQKRLSFLVLLSSALTCIGLVCRFLLEFGEVSNTYNFTLPNIALHMIVFIGVCSVTWLRTAKREPGA